MGKIKENKNQRKREKEGRDTNRQRGKFGGGRRWSESVEPSIERREERRRRAASTSRESEISNLKSETSRNEEIGSET